MAKQQQRRSERRSERRGDDGPIAPDDAAGLAALEAIMEEQGRLYLRDWLASLTPEERASYDAELARLAAEADSEVAAEAGEPPATAAPLAMEYDDLPEEWK